MGVVCPFSPMRLQCRHVLLGLATRLDSQRRGVCWEEVFSQVLCAEEPGQDSRNATQTQFGPSSAPPTRLTTSSSTVLQPHCSTGDKGGGGKTE